MENVKDDMARKMKQELLDDGWVNDHTYCTYSTDKNGVPSVSLGQTAVYNAWDNMKQRCTSKKLKEKYPTYIGVTASDEFKNFTFFHDWWYKQIGHDFHDVQLDKDLLIKGNKVYSSNTCLLVPSFVNMFLVKSDATRGDYTIGVHKHSVYKNGDTRYQARVREYDVTTNKSMIKHLGYFLSELDAFNVYKTAKESIAKKYATYLSGKVDDRVIDALLNFTVNIND